MEKSGSSSEKSGAGNESLTLDSSEKKLEFDEEEVDWELFEAVSLLEEKELELSSDNTSSSAVPSKGSKVTGSAITGCERKQITCIQRSA